MLCGISLAGQKKPAQKTPEEPRPNFSGRWINPADKGPTAEIVVTMDEKSLSKQRPDGSHKESYQLDGVERRMALPASVARMVDSVMSSAKWNGNRIVIVTNTNYSNGMRTKDEDVWSFDAQGRLVIQTTESGPGAPPKTTRGVFNKKTS